MTPEEAKETVRIALSGAGPTAEQASYAFDEEFQEALEILYPTPDEDTMIEIKFFTIEDGMGTVFCSQCIEKWKKDSEAGKLVEDELYKDELVGEEYVLPVMCDSCGLQSDNYDDLSPEDD